MFVERFAVVNSKLDDTTKSIRANEQEVENGLSFQSAAELSPQIRTVLEAYRVAETAQEKNELLKTVISKIEYSKNIRGIPGVPSDQFELKIFPALKARRT